MGPDELDLELISTPPRKGFTLLPPGGFLASAVTLGSATLGAGIISLPDAYKRCGAGVATAFLVFCAAGTIYSLYLIGIAAQATELRTYESMSKRLLGKTASYFSAFLMFLFCFGAMVAFVTTLHSLLVPWLGDSTNLPDTLRGPWGPKILTIVIWSVTMLPICIPAEINALRYVSFVGVMAIIYFVGLVLVQGFEAGYPSDLPWGRADRGALVGLSLSMFAFMCQVNAPEVFAEMTYPSPTKMRDVGLMSMATCTTLYILTGLFGYIQFGAALKGAIVENFHPRDSAAVTVAFVGITIKLVAVFGLSSHPSRDAVMYCLGMPTVDVCSTPKRVAVSVSIAVAALVLGLVVPSLDLVFGLVGGLCGGMLGFVYPALFVIQLGWTREKVGLASYLMVRFMVAFGVVMSIVGTVSSLLELFV